MAEINDSGSPLKRGGSFSPMKGGSASPSKVDLASVRLLSNHVIVLLCSYFSLL